MECVLIKTSTGELLETREFPELPGRLNPVKDCQWYAIEDAPVSAIKNLLVGNVTKAVQARLDAFAQTRGYDSMLSLCTYATSSNSAFAVEGQRGVDLRDQAWATSYQILSDVENGIRPVPTIEQVIAELPTLNW